MTAQNQAAKADNADSGATEQPVRKDPFEGLATIKLNEASVLDLSGVQVSNPRKYQKIDETARAGRLPMQANWKHSAAMFVPGNVTKEFRAGSVFGTLVDIVKRAGKAGIASYDLTTELRRAQAANNKRSHYCEQVPPVGWAEGYINSAVTQGLIGVHASRKAPALTAPAPAADSGDGDKGTGTNG